MYNKAADFAALG